MAQPWGTDEAGNDVEGGPGAAPWYAPWGATGGRVWPGTSVPEPTSPSADADPEPAWWSSAVMSGAHDAGSASGAGDGPAWTDADGYDDDQGSGAGAGGPDEGAGWPPADEEAPAGGHARAGAGGFDDSPWRSARDEVGTPDDQRWPADEESADASGAWPPADDDTAAAAWAADDLRWPADEENAASAGTVTADDPRWPADDAGAAWAGTDTADEQRWRADEEAPGGSAPWPPADDDAAADAWEHTAASDDARWPADEEAPAPSAAWPTADSGAFADRRWPAAGEEAAAGPPAWVPSDGADDRDGTLAAAEAWAGAGTADDATSAPASAGSGAWAPLPDEGRWPDPGDAAADDGWLAEPEHDRPGLDVPVARLRPHPSAPARPHPVAPAGSLPPVPVPPPAPRPPLPPLHAPAEPVRPPAADAGWATRPSGGTITLAPDHAPPVRADDTPPGAPARRSSTRNAVEWVVIIGAALVAALVIKTYLLQAFYIPSPSMEPTLMIQDRVLVNKLSYRLHDVHRGDVVVFERPPNDVGAIRDLIKRVVGLPGDTVEGRDGDVWINGRPLNEPYLPDGTVTSDFAPKTIPQGYIWVMGDNRSNSSDSRVFGPVDEDRIVGRAFVRVWPIDSIGLL